MLRVLSRRRLRRHRDVVISVINVTRSDKKPLISRYRFTFYLDAKFVFHVQNVRSSSESAPREARRSLSNIAIRSDMFIR